MSDAKVSKFAKRVHEAICTVPKGKVTTYKELGKAVGSKSYQAIGQVMRNNPFAPEVPCHRVVSSDGSIGGFKGEKEGKAIKEKVSLLKKEGVVVEDGFVKDFEKVCFNF